MAQGKIVVTAEDKTQEALSSVQKNFLNVGHAVEEMGKKFSNAVGILAVVEALKKAGEFAIDCVKEFGNMERTMIQLKTAFGDNEASFRNMNDLIEEMSTKTLSSKDDVEKLVAELASLGKSDSQIKQITEASVALSNVTGKDLNSSMLLINATYDGTAGKLGKLIPEIGNLTKNQLEAGGAVDILNSKFGAISNSMSTGIAQKFSNLSKSITEFKEELGADMAPKISPIVDWISKIATSWANNMRVMREYREAEAGYALEKSNEDKLKIALGQQLMVQQDMLARSRLLAAKMSDFTGGVTPTSTKDINNTLQFMGRQQEYKDINGTGGLKDKFEELAKQIKSLEDALKPNKGSTGGNLLEPNEAYSIHGNGTLFGDRGMGGLNGDQAAILNEFDKERIIGGTNLSSLGASGELMGSHPRLGSDYLSAGASGELGGGHPALGGLAALLEPLTSAFGPLVSAIQPLINIFMSANPVMGALMPIIQGFISVVGPAISAVIKPLFDALSNVGVMLGKAILPILQAITPIFNILANIIGIVLTPAIALLSPFIDMITMQLQLMEPVLKALEIAIIIMTSPLKFLADLFTWIGTVFQTVGHNIAEFANHILDPWNAHYSGVGDFSSDAFTGLAGEIAKAWAEDPTSNLSAYGTGTGSSGSSAATYQGAPTVNVYITNNAPLVSDSSLDSFAEFIEVRINQKARFA